MLRKAVILLALAVLVAMALGGWHWRGKQGTPQAGWAWGEDSAQIVPAFEAAA